jgi:hypothetical protein
MIEYTNTPLIVGLEHLSSEQAAELAALGPPLEVIRPDSSSRRRNAGMLWAGIGVGLLGLTAAVGVAVEASRAAGAEAVSRGFGAACMGLFGVFFLSACGWRLRQLHRGRGVVVLACRDGLARLNGNELFACRWDEIEEVEGRASRFQAQIGRRVILTVRTARGALRLDTAREHLPGLEALYARVGIESAGRQVPRMLAAIEAGQTVPFGRLGLSSAGVHCGDRLLPWGEVASLSVHEALRIQRRGAGRLDWWHRATFLVPNLHAFLRVVEHHLRRASSVGAS